MNTRHVTAPPILCSQHNSVAWSLDPCLNSHINARSLSIMNYEPPPVVFKPRPVALTLRDLSAQIAAVCPPPDAFANVSSIQDQHRTGLNQLTLLQIAQHLPKMRALCTVLQVLVLKMEWCRVAWLCNRVHHMHVFPNVKQAHPMF